MDNKRFKCVAPKRLPLMLPLLMLFCCEEWTPPADGYYLVDGRRYNVHIMAIHGAGFPEPDANNIEVTFQGAPYFNVTMFVTSPGNTLAAGDYHVSNYYELRGINFLSVRTGKSSEYSSDRDSEGSMSVETSGNSYLLDFDGNIEGHNVQIHYSGLVHKD